MADYRTVGAHELNKWLWDKLQTFVYDGTNLAFADYTAAGGSLDLIPIIPSQQVPEFTNIVGGAPFIVYNYVVSTTAPRLDFSAEQCVYSIYDNNEERLRAIHSYIVDLLKRLDWTAAEVNSYLATLGTSKFDFKTVWITSASGPGVYTDQGGRSPAIVMAKYQYTHDTDGIEGSGLRS